MAVGDQADIAARIRSVLPTGWFPQSVENATPVLDGVIAGLAWPWALLYQLLSYAINQTRLQTSTGNLLDIAAQDYFGDTLPRTEDETDAAYIARIKTQIVAPRNTRAALSAAVAAVSADAAICEPWRAPDCGCYGREAYGGTQRRYGSRSAPGSVFIRTPARVNETDLQKAIVNTKAAGVDVFYTIES